MDFPLDLNKCFWVSGTDELEQAIKLVLSNPVKTWMQSNTFGSLIPLHSTSVVELETNVRETLKAFSDIVVESVSSRANEVTVHLQYNHRELEYTINLT